MRIFKTKWLARFARREKIDDASLVAAIERAARGLVDADLGDGLIKQRVARPGEGRRGGYRVLIGYRAGARAVFLFAFAKNVAANINEAQLAELRLIGQSWLEAGPQAIDDSLELGTIMEVRHDEA